MQLTLTLDLATIISNAVSAERIQPLLDKAVSDAIRSAIESATNYTAHSGQP